MAFYESSLLLLEPIPESISRNRGAMLARGALRGALARRAGSSALAFAVPGIGTIAAGANLAMTAWDLWNAFQPDQPLPFPNVSVPFPPQTTDRSWEIDITFFLQQAPGGLLPSRTVTATGVPFFGRIDDIRLVVSPGSKSFVAFGFNSIDGPTSVALGGGNDNFLAPQLISLNVRLVGSTEILRPAINPVVAPGTTPVGTDVPIDIDIPQTPGGWPYPVQIPALVRQPGALGSRPVPIIYDPTLPEDQRRALPQAWITPEGVQIGGGTRNAPIVLTPDGAASIIDLLDLASDYRLRNPPEVTTCTGEPEPPGDCCDCDDIRQIVIEELDSKFPPSRPNNEVTDVLGAGDSGEFVLPPFSKFVELEVLFSPETVRTQSGNANAPDVFYNGWYSLGAESGPGERIPFHYNLMTIPVSNGERYFSFTVIGGGTARAKVTYIQET